MALPEYYLMTTKNLESFLNSLLNAQAPPKFTLKFLESLEFKSTNDRLFIGVLKGIKFIDANNVPTEKYFQFLDQTESKKVLANAIREVYADLFAIKLNANELSATEVIGKMKTIFQGQKSDNVIGLMANTFVALCKYADFSASQASQSKPHEVITINPDENKGSGNTFPNNGNNGTKVTHELVNKHVTTEMHYNIQIHLPETRDHAVYDAIFKSLKEHLL